jgi:hypothetical protein
VNTAFCPWGVRSPGVCLASATQVWIMSHEVQLGVLLHPPHPSRWGVPEFGHPSRPGLLCDSLVFADETAENGLALDPLPGKAADRVVGLRRAECVAAVGSPSVAVRAYPARTDRRCRSPKIGIRAANTDLSA